MLDKICSGIVLYNPEINRLEKNLDSVLAQISEIVLIDNKSQNKPAILSVLEKYHNVNVIWNERNLGIAAALNQIISFAHDHGCKWALLLDQDSVLADGFVDSYRLHMNDYESCIVCPQIMDINLKNTEKAGIDEIECSTEVITSGSCIPVEDCIGLGGFNEEFFIDYVDTEFQERWLRSGRRIIRINDAHLYHEVGSMKERRILWFKVLCSNHNPLRRYYMVRNRLFFKYKYFGKRGYVKEYIRLMLGTIKIVVFEEQKAAKVKAFFKGVSDTRKLIEEEDQ